MVMELSEADFLARAKELYGENTQDWKFTCNGCQHTQSAISIIDQNKKKVASKRHGILKAGDPLRPDCECYCPDCNHVAYGLFNSHILIIVDPSKPHNEATKENCYYIFPLADDAVMRAASGVKPK
jgi:hypothetical protein